METTDKKDLSLKKPYSPPHLKTYGSLADMTATGPSTNPLDSDDAVTGYSVAAS